MGERIIFISDLHLGDNSYDEAIEQRYLDFLEKIASNATELVIVGDLFEMSQRFATEIIIRTSKSIAAIWQLSKKIKVTYVVGNHDLFFAKFLGTIENIELKYPAYRKCADGKTIHAEHGHLYQREYRNNPTIYNLIATFGRFTDDISPSIEDVLGSMLKGFEHVRSILHPSKKTGQKHLTDYEEQAEALGKEGTDIVIFGHTHEPYIKRFDTGTVYVNVGDWQRLEHCNYAVFENGAIDLYSYPEGKIDFSA